MGLVRASLRNPYAVIVAALAVMVIGVVCYRQMPLDILPQFKTPAVQILTLYPGMPTEIVERDMTSRLERWTSQSMGVAWQESRSMVGVSVVRDYFRDDIDPNAAYSQVSALALSDLYYLPPGTIPPMTMLFDPTASVPLGLVACSSDTLDETAVYDFAYFEMRNMLSGTPGVIAPAVFGGKLRRVYVYLDPQKVQAQGLSPLDVVNTLTKFNLMIPTGNTKIGDIDYSINAESMVEKVSDLNDLPVKMKMSDRDGSMRPVLIKDIGRAEDTNAIQTNVVRIARPSEKSANAPTVGNAAHTKKSGAGTWGAKRQVYIPIYRQPGSNSLQVIEGTKQTLETAVKPRAPQGFQARVVGDQTVFIRQAIASLQKEGVLGALLASFMILIFLGSFRSTLVVFLSIPLSILAAFIGLRYTGNTINTMTLGGLALALGRLVDDAIVVLENTDRHLQMGKPPHEAAKDGATEVAMPVLVATITTIVVFFPVTFLYGMGKYLFTPLALAVAFSMAASYLVAMTLVPAYAARFLRGHGAMEQSNTPSLHRSNERGWFAVLSRNYSRGLNRSMRAKPVVLLVVCGLFVASLALFPRIGRELFPPLDAGQITVQVRLPSGTRIEKTEETLARVELKIQAVIPPHDREMLITNIGVLYDWPAAYTPNAGPHDGFVLVQLTMQHRKVTSYEYADLLRAKLAAEFPGVQFSFNTGGIVTAALNFGLPSPIDIQVEGKSLEQLYAISRDIKEVVQKTPGAVDARIQQELDYPQVNIKVDRIKAAALGLTQEEVVKNIVTALNSSVNFKPAFWLDYQSGNHYFVGASYREEDIKSFESLLDLPITSPATKQPVVLRNIATLERSTVPTEIAHNRIRRVMDIYANVSGRDVGSVAAEIQRKVAKLNIEQKNQGYFVHFRGEVNSMEESFRSLGFAFILAALLIYLVMVAQFQSFVDPFIIMFAVPLGLIGVLVTLFVTRTTLNVESFMGVIFMVGIAVSNSILLVEFANRMRAEGRSANEAAVEAARVRLRPILMTSLAAVIALFPMALAKGEATAPLARAVIGGLSMSTLLTLFVVPMLYEIIKRGPATRIEEG
ncbi:MAG: AcrB/AcrD/AcrF family protein [Armatimonadetes bacterium CG_4_8_14_3_um_filter_58_9]|nr:MAG: AcrB/AcrD/AcrF family protein [Armatimonadetes bacterium CG_4_8_14_3_um_filter_58_9]